LLSGLRIYCLVGFCDIHHFDDVNHLLEKDILTFVNTIAEVVHDCVHSWGGQCNKNLGNAFVIIWRIGDEEELLNITSGAPRKDALMSQPTGIGETESVSPGTSIKRPRPNSATSKSMKVRDRVVDLRRVPGIDELADKALIGYLKIIAEINRRKKILSFRSEPRLIKNGDFKVRMGFGLHAGWAIEGAVGSLQKVDATYLSPHINMAARLETSSRQYGVPLLASQNFVDLMSQEGRDYMRRLDVVTVKGSEVPIGIFTYDCLQDQIFSPSEKDDPDTDGKFMSSSDDAADVFEEDTDLVQLRRHITEDFTAKFFRAVEKYLAGDWPEAKILLKECDDYMTKQDGMEGDGPSRTLINYIEEHHNKAPESWKGFRPLTAK